jgi:hypothetical protein
MYKIIVKGEASTDYPNLSELDGIDCQEDFSSYFGNDEKSLIIKGVTSGYMSFQFENGNLYTITQYSSNEELTLDELEILKDYTQGQWSDGIGEGFEQEPCYFGNEYDNDSTGDRNVYMSREVYISPWHVGQLVSVTQHKV